ncbi:MAG TPA: papain-like cysteine protease family protein [Candidatus Binatia bacterium]|nr:papain-like cysteine protease family protein [Candidatus Binatia bacterium]
MRSFTSVIFALVSAALVAIGCGPGPEPTRCGDGRCDYVEGESNYSCPADCPPGGPGGPDGGAPGAYCGDHLPLNDGDGVQLAVPELPQQCQEWCWAATTTMVAQYYGIQAQECVLASIKAGFQQPVCCQYSACSYQACDQAAPPNQIDVILGQVLGIHGYENDGAITQESLALEISNGRPVIIGYLNSFAGHVVLVTGFRRLSYHVFQFHVVDPYYGVFDVDYNQLRYGYMGAGASWSWAFTWMHLSPRADGCNLDWDPGCSCN